MVSLAGLVALFLSAGLASAATPPEVAAEQLQVRTSQVGVIGGASSQRMAQVFWLGRDATISHLMLPIACQPGAVVRVTIEQTTAGVPNGNVLAVQDVPGYALDGFSSPAGTAWRMVEFTRPPMLPPGEYAFTVSRKGKYDCSIWAGPAGDAYTAGKAFFIATGNGPGWIELFDAGGAYDMAFQVYARPN